MPDIRWSAAILAVLSMLVCNAGRADERRDWFKSLIVPGTSIPCCDAADCERTDAKYEDGSWWAVVRNRWIRVPPWAVLKRPRSIDGDAYVCSPHTRDDPLLHPAQSCDVSRARPGTSHRGR